MRLSYRTLKYINISLNLVDVPVSVYAGASLALGNILPFIVGIIVITTIACVGTAVYWKTLERLPKNTEEI